MAVIPVFDTASDANRALCTHRCAIADMRCQDREYYISAVGTCISKMMLGIILIFIGKGHWLPVTAIAAIGFFLRRICCHRQDSQQYTAHDQGSKESLFHFALCILVRLANLH